jgi:hypothetical protein
MVPQFLTFDGDLESFITVPLVVWLLWFWQSPSKLSVCPFTTLSRSFPHAWNTTLVHAFPPHCASPGLPFLQAAAKNFPSEILFPVFSWLEERQCLHICCQFESKFFSPKEYLFTF